MSSLNLFFLLIKKGKQSIASYVYSRVSFLRYTHLKLICRLICDAIHRFYCQAQVQVQVRLGSCEGQEGLSQAKSSSENSKLKDLDLSSTLFLVFTTTHHHTNFFLGFKWV